ncbi:MAG TPA: ABC transporter permease [Vicinamibacterales bacterium]
MTRTLLYLMRWSLRRLWRARLSSALALTMASLGLAGVLASVSYSAASRQQVLAQIRRLGTNVLIVTPTESRAVGGRARTGAINTTLIERDYRDIRQGVPSLVRASAWVSRPFTLKARDLSKTTTVIGCEPAYFDIKSWAMADGRPFDTAEDRRLARVVLLGQTVARDLFGRDSPVGARLFINRVPFHVVGVLAERGQSLDVSNEDDEVYVPLRTAMHRLMNIDYYNGLLLQLNTLDDMDAAAGATDQTLQRFHHATPRIPIDYQIENQKTLIDAQTTAANRLAFFVWWIGVSGLVVAGLGMVAIAWIGVKARTTELGTRRAVGSSAALIFFQIAFEAAVLALAGCAIGLALGWYGSAAIAWRAGLPFVFEWRMAGLALLSAFLLNVAFSTLPALRAARLDPIRALTFE